MTVQTLERPKATQQIRVNGAVPPLELGDHLTRAEFERRYHLHPEIKKAELIEGVVILRSEVFPGIWLDAPAFWAGTMGKVLEVLQAGLASPEHAAFVAVVQEKSNSR